MSDNTTNGKEEIFSKVLRAGRRTYFFDVRATKANDFYLTITESKKHEGHNGEAFYKKHKIYLYKEDFERFREILDEVTDYIINEKGEEVISERHNPEFKRYDEDVNQQSDDDNDTSSGSNAFTSINFEEI
jgi:hypothetical protein